MRDLVKMANADVQIVTTMTTAHAYVRDSAHKISNKLPFFHATA